ncbi:olfactory receptor 2G3-like [Lissotriton helveticus]
MPSAQWFTEDLRLQRQYCRNLERRWRKHYRLSDKQTYKDALALYKKAIIKHKIAFFLAKIESAQNSARKLFQVVDSLSNPPTGPPIEPSQDLCNAVATFFFTKVMNIYSSFSSPICSDRTDPFPMSPPLTPTFSNFHMVTTDQISKIITSIKSGSPLDPCPPSILSALTEVITSPLTDLCNSIFQTVIYPEIWKKAVIKPLLKKPSLDPADSANCRPIACLPFPAKIFEAIMNKQLSGFIDCHQLLDDTQFGFRKGHGTEMALIKTLDEIRTIMDQGELKVDTLEMRNGSWVAGFIMMGLSDDRTLETILFVLFLVLYILTLIGNVILITVCVSEPRLHTPMYFFLVNLSMLDICFSSVTVPYILAQLIARRSISLIGCAAQMYTGLLLGSTECVLLAVMAYDRYVAIVFPLRYTVIMSMSVCNALVCCCLLSGSVMAFLDTFFTVRLPVCGPRIINHFWCECTAFLKMSCVDTFVTEMVIFSAGIFALLLPSVFTAISYICIITTIVRVHSTEARYKAFSTCASHLTVVIIFYSTAISMYMKPGSKTFENRDKIISVFYTVTPPLLNPIIYSLRNKDVKIALQKYILPANLY